MINLQALLHELLYDPKKPLLFNSGFFVYFFLVFLFCFMAVRNKPKARLMVFTGFSLYFFYKACGSFVLLVLVSAVTDFIISNAIYRQQNKRKKKALLVLSIVLNLGLLFYFKYTNFFITLVNDFGIGHVNPLNLALPIGISFYTFENLSYTIDVYKGIFKPVTRFIDYLFFLSFFPKLVMGPIVRAADFIPQIYKHYDLNNERLSQGFYLIFTGLFKKVVISDFLQTNYVYRVFEDPESLSRLTGVECLLGVYCYAMVIYCDFSGYSDMAIGIARWFGFDIPANFDSPYQSSSITEFWRRWHISLSSWLRDYLYIPLGGNRKGKLRTYINLFITMLLGGFWHGASFNFIIWGGMHGGALAVEKMISKPKNKEGLERKPRRWRKIAGVFLTFHFVCFCWIFFKAQTLADAVLILKQIGTNLHPELIGALVAGYTGVVLMLLVAFLLHFTPARWGQAISRRLEPMPAWGYFVLFAVFMWIFIQTKTSEQVLPIYLQF